jgi:hypothetical protein
LTLWRKPLVAAVLPKHEFSVKNINEISIHDFSYIPFIHRSRSMQEVLRTIGIAYEDQLMLKPNRLECKYEALAFSDGS